MRLADLVEVCATHRPVVIVLAPEDYDNAAAFAERATHGDWRLSPSGGALSYQGVPIVRSLGWGHSYLVEDRPEGPLIHQIG